MSDQVSEAYIVDGIRTPIGAFGGSLRDVRPDDMAALVIQRLLERHPGIDRARIADVILGCANQAGEDNRNVARMAALLAGLPVSVPGETVNRLCASGMSAIANAARAIKLGDGDLYIAGGVESMTRAPYVLSKSPRGLCAGRPAVRHEHRVAVRQRAHAAPVRRRRDGRDRRERRPGVSCVERRPGPICLFDSGPGGGRPVSGAAGAGDHGAWTSRATSVARRPASSTTSSFAPTRRSRS